MNKLFTKRGLITISHKGLGDVTVPLKTLSFGVYSEEFDFVYIQNSLILWSCIKLQQL